MKTETLLTCPDCGTPNFYPRGLKAHRGNKHCLEVHAERAAAAPAPTGRAITFSDLDVLPPPKRPAQPGAAMPLVEIEEHIRGFDAKITDRTYGYHNEVIYDIAAEGLMFLKAQAHYVFSNLRETVSLKCRKRNGKGQLAAAEDGFFGWLRRTYCQGPFKNEAEAARFFQSKKRSAYNYMKLATNNGLTSDHTLDHIEAMRADKALHGRNPTEFYKGQLALDAANIEPEKPEPPVNLVAEVKRDLFEYLDQALSLRDEMPPEDYEDTWHRLRDTLQKLTGRQWEMQGEPPMINATEHAALTFAPDAKAQRTTKKGGR